MSDDVTNFDRTYLRDKVFHDYDYLREWFMSEVRPLLKEMDWENVRTVEPKSVLVDRARFLRLVSCADALNALVDLGIYDTTLHLCERAVNALQPGDTDPLP